LDSCFFTSVNIIMADQYTPEEIRAIFEEYNNATKGGSQATAELTKRFKDAQVGIKNYTDQLNSSLKSLGSSILGTAKAIKDGEQGASVFNSGITAAADAVEAFTAKFGFLGKILGTMLTAGARYAAEVNKQSDALFKTYKDLSQTGLADAGGMRTIFDNMQKFGYGINELGNMTELLKQNSKELATFGGTAASGTKAFADAAGQIQRSDVGKSLQMLGKTPDEINKGMAMFVKQQQGLGVSSANINQNLAQKSADYIKNLDLLSKLTGDSAEQLQAKLDDAQSEEAFNQMQYELKQKMLAGDQEAAKQYAKNEELAQRLDGEARREFIKGVGGDMAAFSKTLITAPGAVQAYLDNTKTASEALDELNKGYKTYREGIGQLGKLNAANDVGLPLQEMGKTMSRLSDETAQQQKDRAKAEQELQTKGLDPATKAQVELRIEQMKTRDEFQSLINKGINPVTKGMAKLAGAIETVVDKIPGTATSTETKIGGGESGGVNYWKKLFGLEEKKPADATEQILATIRKRESGGNYQAQAKGSSASGAYQFIDSTWQSLTKKTGVGTEYAKAKDAPKEIQDAIAKAHVEGILKQAGGDVSKVPLAWYTGNIQGKMSDKALAANNGLTAEKYQEKWLADFNKTGGANKIAGPTGKYESSVADVKPEKTLPAKESTMANQAKTVEDGQTATYDRMIELLEKQTRLATESNDNLGRIRQNTAAG
jgi:DNA-binding transcriptional MerR regulator